MSNDYEFAIVTGGPCEHMHRQTMNLRWGPEGEPLRLEQAWTCIACGDTIWKPIPKALVS